MTLQVLPGPAGRGPVRHRRGGPVPDRVFEEIRELYGGELRIAQSFNTEGRGVWADQDRPQGQCLQLKARPDSPWATVGWRGSEFFVPKDQQSPLEVSLDDARDRMAVLFYRSPKACNVVEYRLTCRPDGSRGLIPEAQSGFPQALIGLEYDREGNLLGAQGATVKRLGPGQAEDWLQLPSPVRDLNTLSDGGLCIRTAEPHALQLGLYYLPPDGTEILELSPAAVAPFHKPHHQPARFLSEMSLEQQEAFLCGSLGPSWFWNRETLLEFTSGENTVALAGHKGPPSIYARAGTTDLGCVSRWGDEPDLQQRFAAGFAAETCEWSPDGRFFSVASAVDPGNPQAPRDLWLWDGLARISCVIPHLQSWQWSEQGLHLESGLGPARQWNAEQIEQVMRQPRLVVGQEGLCRVDHLGQRQMLVASEFLKPGQWGYFPDRSAFLWRQDSSSRYHLWDGRLDLELELDGVEHVDWDKGEVTLRLPEGQTRCDTMAGLRDSPHYREALERKLGLATTPVAPVRLGGRGIHINGLTFPLRAHTSERADSPTP